MEQPSVIHSTFVLERSFPKPPEKVFAAFADPAVKRRWCYEGDGTSIDSFECDFRVGGIERASYIFYHGTPVDGLPFVNLVTFQNIVPNRRVVAAGAMTMDGKPITCALVTFELLANNGGTDLVCTHQGAFFEGSDGPQMRELGWRYLLDRLGAVLSAE